MKKVPIFCVLLGTVLVLNPVWADDYNPPPWRGENNTTTQIWEFPTDTNPSDPDSYVNPNGTANLTVTGDFPFTAWLADDKGHQGVWKFEDFIKIDIANYVIQNPYKEIWIQLTFAADGGAGLSPLINTVPTLTGVPTLIDKQQVDSYYWRATYSLIIEPNPDFESIYIQPRDCTMYLDELVIDTICVPEPTTICLISLGTLVLLRKRKA